MKQRSRCTPRSQTGRPRSGWSPFHSPALCFHLAHSPFSTISTALGAGNDQDEHTCFLSNVWRKLPCRLGWGGTGELQAP